MALYRDDPNDKDYVIFGPEGKLIDLINAVEDIKQKYENGIGPGGICYVLSEIISLAPIIENYISIKELSQTNGIRQFEVKNNSKGNTKSVGLRIGKIPGFPKSEKGIDIQVLLEYLKEEIRDADNYLISKIKRSKNGTFDFNDLDENQYQPAGLDLTLNEMYSFKHDDGTIYGLLKDAKCCQNKIKFKHLKLW